MKNYSLFLYHSFDLINERGYSKSIMKLKTFLLNIQKEEPITEPVICFSGDNYPVLFFSHFLAKLKKQGLPVQSLSMDSIDWQAFEGRLQTTFLGATELLWLGNISECDAVQKKKLLGLLSEYRGPHTLFFFATKKDTPDLKKSALIDCDEQFQKADIEIIFQFLWNTSSEQFIAMMKIGLTSLTLDNCVLLGQYSLVLGNKTHEFMRDWYEKILLPEESLFTLAQCFFARNPQMFFRSWISLRDVYAAPFWTTFWSEQLWRAYHVIDLRLDQKFNEAKQMSFRLPFSFLQRDWKQITTSEIRNAHHFLYQADCRVKSGGSLLCLELFFNKFMQKQF